MNLKHDKLKSQRSSIEHKKQNYAFSEYRLYYFGPTSSSSKTVTQKCYSPKSPLSCLVHCRLISFNQTSNHQKSYMDSHSQNKIIHCQDGLKYNIMCNNESKPFKQLNMSKFPINYTQLNLSLAKLSPSLVSYLKQACEAIRSGWIFFPQAYQVFYQNVDDIYVCKSVFRKFYI